MAQPGLQRVTLITVHGTGDTAASLDGEKWFQRGSPFAQRLVARLAEHGLTAEIAPFLWSGANSARERERAACLLARGAREAKRPVHLIGHSHGGNVVNDAAVSLGWGRKKRVPIASATTVGTPFFRASVTLWEVFASLAFVALAVAGLIQLYIIVKDQIVWWTLWDSAADYAASMTQANPLPQEGLSAAEIAQNTQRQMARYAAEYAGVQRDIALTFWLSVFSALAFVLLLPSAIGDLFRKWRLMRGPAMSASMLTIWHPNDEAIAFLQRVERVSIEPFPRGALWRGSAPLAASWALRVVLLVVIPAIVIWLLDPIGVPQWLMSAAALFGLSSELYLAYPEYPAELGARALAGGSLIFIIAYVVARIVAGIVPEWALRRSLNASVGRAIASAAFGRDGGAYIGEVASASHNFAGRQVLVEGEVAARMQANAAASADHLLGKYRWPLFSVDAQDDGAAVLSLANDALTWDSLIHTTYFDQPEIADLIADHIAAEVRGSPSAGAPHAGV